MINFKKSHISRSRLFLFLAVAVTVSCNTQKLHNTRIEGKQIPVTAGYGEVAPIENFIAPYRAHIDKDLDSILAYSPETLDKGKGKWQTTIGNFMADVTFEKADKLFHQREKKAVDICLLNHGGIRAIIPKGNITARTAFEVMPFENSVYVIALKGAQVKEMAAYIIKEKKPHPLSGMKIIIDKNDAIKDISIQDKPVEDAKIYYVATSDYLANGGDNMNFFKKAVASYDMDYKLRNLLIDYFREVDTLPVITTQRIITE